MSETKIIDWDSMSDTAEVIHTWANCTFPGRTPEGALTKLGMAEIPELLTHFNARGPEGIAGEWADCMILLLDLAKLWGLDPARAIEAKMQVNARRVWKKNEALGHWQHASVETPTPDFSNAERARSECDHRNCEIVEGEPGGPYRYSCGRIEE